MPENQVREPMTLERLKGLVEKSLAENSMPDNFKAQAYKELAALTRLGGPAYDLLTATNVMSLMSMIEAIDGAAETALTIVEKDEFELRFRGRMDDAEEYVDKLLALRHSTDNSLVKFLKEASNKTRNLLKELRAPYGTCEVCGVNPRTKPFHRTCKACYKPALKPAISNPEPSVDKSDKDRPVTVSRPVRQPEKTAFAFAYENASEGKTQPKRFKTKKVNKKRKKDDFLEEE